MLRVVSTHVFLKERLHPGLLDAIARDGTHGGDQSGAQGVELFAARQHFDYSSRQHVRELADWFKANALEPFSMHQPLYFDAEWGRNLGPTVNVIDPEKSKRIDAMDEIKRALEAAEQIPFRFMVVHLGAREDSWNSRALEHLQAFARPMGVQLLVENLTNEVTEPAHILEVLQAGHFTDMGVCLDLGHAHLTAGIPALVAELKDRIRTTHVHDNHGSNDAGGKDEHLWPGEGSIDWARTAVDLESVPQLDAAVLEIHYALGVTAENIAEKAREAFGKLVPQPVTEK
jgi:sugar phosphate isomerase/epimerase